MGRGFAQKCPSCGQGRLYKSYTVVSEECSLCGQELHHHMADDAPPYITIMIVGHIVVPLLLATERIYAPALWVHFVVWLPSTLGMTLLLLPRVKGSVIGLQWALGMHGFSGPPQPAGKP